MFNFLRSIIAALETTLVVNQYHRDNFAYELAATLGVDHPWTGTYNLIYSKILPLILSGT
jgi:hypothetical protein